MGRQILLTIAMMIIKSSQPKTRFKHTLTYSLMQTKARGTMAITHITPWTVEDLLSARYDADTSLVIVKKT